MRLLKVSLWEHSARGRVELEGQVRNREQGMVSISRANLVINIYMEVLQQKSKFDLVT